jgi:hypothetical protein
MKIEKRQRKREIDRDLLKKHNKERKRKRERGKTIEK